MGDPLIYETGFVKWFFGRLHIFFDRYLVMVSAACGAGCAFIRQHCVQPSGKQPPPLLSSFLIRRHMRLIFAGWVPPDVTVVTERPLSEIAGRRPKAVPPVPGCRLSASIVIMPSQAGRWTAPAQGPDDPCAPPRLHSASAPFTRPSINRSAADGSETSPDRSAAPRKLKTPPDDPAPLQIPRRH